jgi:glycosidase
VTGSRLAVVAALALAGCGAPERDCGVDLWFLGAADQVRVVGDFNGWNGENDPMVAVEEGAWHRRLDLPAGEYRYMIEVDGVWQRDAYAPLMAFDDPVGGERSLLRVDSCAAPAIEVGSAVASADGAAHIEATFQRGVGGPRLGDATATWLDGTAVAVDARPASGELTVDVTGLAPGKHTLRLSAVDRAGAAAEARVSLWVEDVPFAWEDAVIYQVVVDRFATAGGGSVAPEGWQPSEISQRFGGTLAGITARLEDGWFDELGVNALWISPVARVADGWWPGVDGQEYTGYHGYWPVSQDEVEPGFGTEADLRELIAVAHARGVRVLLDVVPNHVHEEHPYFSAHREWFHGDPSCVCGTYVCPWEDDIEACWFTEYLPDFDWTVPGVPDQVADDVLWWAETYDFDGYRVDAVPMLPRAAIRYLVWEAQQRFEAGGQRFYTLGETFTGPTGIDDVRANLGPFGLDGQFEFPMLWSLRDWAAGHGDAADLDAILRESEAAWEGSGSVMAPIVGNHDMDRLISTLAGDPTGDAWGNPPAQPADAAPYERSLLAQVVALTVPGAPVIYYGDEVGLAGAGDPDCRRPMPWTLDDHQGWLLERVRRVAKVRRCATSLRRGDRQTLLVDGPVYAFLRDAGLGGAAVVVANAGDTERAVSFTVPSGSSLPPGAELVDAVEGVDRVVAGAGDTLSLTLPPRSARVLLPTSLDCVSGVAP